MPIEALSRRSGVTTMLRKPRARATSRASLADWASSSVSVTSTVSRRRSAARTETPQRRPGQLQQGGVAIGRGRGEADQMHRVVAEAPDGRRMPVEQAIRAGGIASNTGWTSAGDAAITLRISAVAVCRSSVSRQLRRALRDLALEPEYDSLSVAAI
jgi:hypothetical protein